MEIGYSCIYSNSMDIIFNKYIKHKSNNHILKEIIDFFIYGACVELRFGSIFTLQKSLPFTPFFGVRPDCLWDTNKSQGVSRVMHFYDFGILGIP